MHAGHFTRATRDKNIPVLKIFGKIRDRVLKLFQIWDFCKIEIWKCSNTWIFLKIFK